MTRGRLAAALAALLLPAACGRLGPPVRASQARETRAAAPATTPVAADPADADGAEGKEKR